MKKSILLKSLEASLGLFIFAFGVYLIISADIGVNAWDVFCIGLAGKTGFSYGTCSIMISAVLICVDFFILKEKIGIGIILDTVIVGKSVDLFLYLDFIPKPESLWVSLLFLFAGFLIEGYGQLLYIRVGLGCGPRDSLQIGLGRRMPKIPIGIVNIFILTAVFLIGWALDGPIGIGSLLAPIGTGLLQQFAFSSCRFEPKNVIHQDLRETLTVLLSRNAKRSEKEK